MEASPAVKHPDPIDPSYIPQVSITHLPSTASADDIIEILERDGGVIIDDFVNPTQLDQIKHEVALANGDDLPGADGRGNDASAEGSGIPLVPTQTVLTAGLIGKSATIADICERPVLSNLRRELLRDTWTVNREEYTAQRSSDPLLSISVGFNIGPGAPRQALHRDDAIHGTTHEKYNLRKVSQWACLIAGCETTRANGATMFVPGSHKWDDGRFPRTDEVTFAEMKPGAALIFLGSSFHGGGHNSTQGVRTVYGMFFIRGTLRQEENQFLAVPHKKVLQMSKEMQSLLGYKQPNTVLGIVDNKDPATDLEGVLRRVAVA